MNYPLTMLLKNQSLCTPLAAMFAGLCDPAGLGAHSITCELKNDTERQCYQG
jgi:hypothetical protein